MAEEATLNKKEGYLEVKQSSKVKGRKLKTWRKRWVVVSKMTDHAAHTLAAKIDLYPDDPKKGQGQGRAADRMTFIFENVTAVQLASSKTHPFAFEIVETEPVLVLSGHSELESFSWMNAIRHIFFADGHVVDTSEYFVVGVQEDSETERLGLSGQYTMRISVEGVALLKPRPHAMSDTLLMSPTITTPPKPVHARSVSEGVEHTVRGEGDVVMSWKLGMLKRFDIDKGQFLLDCGPNSPKGAATIRFNTDDPTTILASMRRCISVAMAVRQRSRLKSSESPRGRTESMNTLARYQGLLDRSQRPAPDPHSIPEGGEWDGDRLMSVHVRSGSQSSATSTVAPGTPTSSSGDVPMMTSRDSLSMELDPEKDGAVSTPNMKQRLSVHSMGSAFSSSPGLSDVFSSSSRQLSSSPGTRVSEAFGNSFSPTGTAQSSTKFVLGAPDDPQDCFGSTQGSPPDARTSSLGGTSLTFDAFGSEFQHQQEVRVQQWQQMMMWQQQQQQQQQMQRGSPKLPHQPQHVPQQQLQQQQLQQQQQMRSPQQMQSQAGFAPQYPDPQQLNFWLQTQQQMGMPPEMQQQFQLWMQNFLLEQQKQLFMQQQQQLAGEMSSNTPGLVRNSSVPHDMWAGPAAARTDMVARNRTSSMILPRQRGSESVCSGDSGVVVTERIRKGSNSFDSAVSTESYRLPGDVEPILEFAPAPSVRPPVIGFLETTPLDPPTQSEHSSNKTTPDGSSAHIYQDLDTVRADGTRLFPRNSFSQDSGMGRRRHSTGEVRKEGDYDEIKKVAPTAGALVDTPPASVIGDTPPELPARPASLQHGKAKTMDRKSRLSSALNFLSGSKALKERKARTPSPPRAPPPEDPSCSPVTLSRSGSAGTDLYSTIGDVKRRSSDVTPAASNPDLRMVDTLPKPPLRPRVPLPPGGAKPSFVPDSSSASLNLLTFSDNDLSQLGRTSTPRVKMDSMLDTKAALMDFFLNDTTFHANPMVTGQLKLGGASSSQLRGSDPNLPMSRASALGGSGFVNPSSTAWAAFPNQTQCTNTLAWPMGVPSSPAPGLVAPASPALSPPPGRSTGITARVEGVYIDMRQTGGECEYVSPGELSEKDRNMLDFLLLQ